MKFLKGLFWFILGMAIRAVLQMATEYLAVKRLDTIRKNEQNNVWQEAGATTNATG